MPRAWPPQTPLRTRAWPPPGIRLAATQYFLSQADNPNGTDPSNILNGNAAVINRSGVRFALENPATVSVPSAAGINGCYVEWTVRDAYGNAQGMHPGDLARAIGWLLNATNLGVDQYFGIAFTSGGVGTLGNSGVIVGLRYNAAGPEAFHYFNAGAGAGWVSLSAAAAVDALTRGIGLQVHHSGNATSTRWVAAPVDASGANITTNNAPSTPSSGNANTDGAWTKVALVAGWVTGVGGGASNLDCAVVSCHSRLQDIPGFARPT